MNKYRKGNTLESFIEYKKADAYKKRTLSDMRNNSWKNLCESANLKNNRYTPISKIWSYIRKFKRINIASPLKSDEFIPGFLDKLFQSSIPVPNLELEDNFNANNDTESVNFFSKPFEWNELCYALNSRKGTAPGLDDLPYIVLKKLHTSAQNILLRLLN